MRIYDETSDKKTIKPDKRSRRPRGVQTGNQEKIVDLNGRFVAAGNGEIDWCGDALMGEALALQFGLNLTITFGCNRIEVNSDNIEVIKTMKNGNRSFGPSAAVIDDTYHLVCDFPHIIFEHAPRESNYVALCVSQTR